MASSLASCTFCKEPIDGKVVKEIKDPQDVDFVWLRSSIGGPYHCVKLNIPMSTTEKCEHIVHGICFSYTFQHTKPQCPQCSAPWKTTEVISPPSPVKTIYGPPFDFTKITIPSIEEQIAERFAKPNQDINKKIAFVCALIEGESPEKHQKILDYLHSIAFDWGTFFDRYGGYVRHNDRLIPRDFATLYVRDALNKNSTEHIVVLFGPTSYRLFIFTYVFHNLKADEKNQLKQVLIATKNERYLENV